ncbi:MAG TPA: TetR/AcrR family transcriptional regulator [Stellaceae bacterium]|nr:TetR/AcrR family transcriptional regulator [Stellaceae bacterium]
MKENVTQFKKALILRAACKLFFERGYTATTIDAITEELSSSRRAIYDHFAGKAEILSEICEQSVRFSIDLAERVAREPGDPSEKLRRLARDFTMIVIENQDYIAVSAREKHFLPVESQKRILRMQERFDRILRSILADGVSQGIFDIADPGIAALAIGGMIIWVHSWYRAGGRLSPQEIADSLADTALRTAMSLRPRRASRASS